MDIVDGQGDDSGCSDCRNLREYYLLKATSFLGALRGQRPGMPTRLAARDAELARLKARTVEALRALMEHWKECPEHGGWEEEPLRRAA